MNDLLLEIPTRIAEQLCLRSEDEPVIVAVKLRSTSLPVLVAEILGISLLHPPLSGDLEAQKRRWALRRKQKA